MCAAIARQTLKVETSSSQNRAVATAWWKFCVSLQRGARDAHFTRQFTSFCACVGSSFFTFRRRRFHRKKQGFLDVANVDFQNARFATLSRHFRVSLQFRANEEDFNYPVNYNVLRSPQKTPKCGKQKYLKRIIIDHGLTSRFATPNRWRLAFGHVSASIAC